MNAPARALGSMAYALTRGRILLALLAAHLALALPCVLLFGDALRDTAQRVMDPAAFAAELDFSTWFDLRERLRPAGLALGFSAFGAFLLGIFASAGWLEVLTRRDARPGFRVFAAGAGARMVRFVRVALLSLVAIAAARFVFYGTPSEWALAWLTGGGNDLSDFRTEGAARIFEDVRSGLFVASLAWIVLVSDLARAVMVVRGGRSALVAVFRGVVLFARYPFTSAAAAAVPCAVEVAALFGLAVGIDWMSTGAATDVNLAILFLLTQVAVFAREVARAGRLGALLAIADDDDSRRFERRYGRLSDPVIAAAGGAMTDEFEG